ncbi:protein of unknown function [Hyphomicrobium sp. 1Nfss2.1]
MRRRRVRRRRSLIGVATIVCLSHALVERESTSGSLYRVAYGRYSSVAAPMSRRPFLHV